MRTERVGEQGQLLSSWKEIAVYLGRTIRTCQRLESGMGLPVHRLDGSPKAHVFAYTNELDAWMAQKVDEHEEERRKPRRFVLYGLAGLATLALAFVLFRVAVRPNPEAASNSIAVLPFDDLSREPGEATWAAGLTEDLTTALAKIRGFRVPGRISAEAVKARKLDARQAGLALGVRNLLEGSVRVEGDQLQANVYLINAASGFQSWTETYRGEKKDYLDTREKIARAVLEKLSVTLLAEEESDLRARPTRDIGAYELYLKGRQLIGQVRLEAPEAAVGFFEQALQRDPRFALAYAGLALAYIDLQTHFVRAPAEAFPEAEKAAARALALDPDLAEACAADAWVKFQYKWDWEGAAKSYQQALDLKPSDTLIRSLTRGMHAIYLLSRRQFEDARTEIKLALALDPYLPLLYADSMWIHMSSGRPEEVLEDFRRFSERVGADFEFAYSGAGFACLAQGRIDEAVAMFEKAIPLPWNSGRATAGLVACRLQQGDRAAAEALYEKLCEDRKRTLVSPVMLGFAAAALGRTDAAIEWLEMGEREIDPHMPLINVYAATFLPDFAREPRFVAFLDRLRLPH